MLGFLIAFAVIGFGAILGSDLVIGIGLLGLGLLTVLELIKPQPRLKPVPGGGAPRYKHKLLDAPQDAWETEDAMVWQQMMTMPGGGMMFKPGDRGMAHMLQQSDPFHLLTQRVGGGLTGMRARDFLPFPQYGRQNILEQLFIGFPLSMQAIWKGKIKP